MPLSEAVKVTAAEAGKRRGDAHASKATAPQLGIEVAQGSMPAILADAKRVAQSKLFSDQHHSSKLGRRNLGIKDLIRVGALDVGEHTLYMTPYPTSDKRNGKRFYLGVTKEGNLTYGDQLFKSPSDAGLYVKRLTRPQQVKHNGWNAIKLVKTGETLGGLRARYLKYLMMLLVFYRQKKIENS